MQNHDILWLTSSVYTPTLLELLSLRMQNCFIQFLVQVSLVQYGLELCKLFGLFLQSNCIFGFGVSLLLKQGALMHLTAVCQLLYSVLKLELCAVAVTLKT